MGRHVFHYRRCDERRRETLTPSVGSDGVCLAELDREPPLCVQPELFRVDPVELERRPEVRCRGCRTSATVSEFVSEPSSEAASISASLRRSHGGHTHTSSSSCSRSIVCVPTCCTRRPSACGRRPRWRAGHRGHRLESSALADARITNKRRDGDFKPMLASGEIAVWRS